MKNTRPLFFFLNLTLFLTFDLMILGSGVRAMDAGLACPDWPLCFGNPIPDFHVGVWFEFVHRAIAGLVFFSYLGVIYQLFKTYPSRHPLRKSAWLGFSILLAQILMGGLTVLKLLQSGIVTAHLALAVLFFANLVLIKKRVELDFKFKHAGRKINARYSIPSVIVFGQILLGGWVATTYSGKVCLDFPTCAGQFIPTLQGPLGIQVIHRLGAYFTALVITIFAIQIFRHQKSLKKTGWAMLLMVFVQISLGILNLKLYIPVWLTVIHLAGALILFRITLDLYFAANKTA